jgi:5-formyltetrahydrofolate cyclo-ligase
MRIKRRQLDAATRAQAGQALAAHIAGLNIFRSAATIGTYFATDGEIDPTPLVDLARTQGQAIFLPVLGAGANEALRFARWDAASRFIENRYGIPEPAKPHVIAAPEALDLVLAPLVAFDVQGNRIGMGGGYYDRTFSFLINQAPCGKPILLGLAYEFQKLAHIVPRAWDVPLWGVATEVSLYR